MGVFRPSGSSWTPYARDSAGIGIVVGVLVVIAILVLAIVNVDAVARVLHVGLYLVGTLFAAALLFVGVFWVGTRGADAEEVWNAEVVERGFLLGLLGIFGVAAARFVFDAPISFGGFVWIVAGVTAFALLAGLFAYGHSSRSRLLSVLAALLLVVGSAKLAEHEPRFLVSFWAGPPKAADASSTTEAKKASLLFDLTLMDASTDKELPHLDLELRAAGGGDRVSRRGPGKLALRIRPPPSGQVEVVFTSDPAGAFKGIHKKVVVDGITSGSSHHEELTLWLYPRG